MGKPQNGDRVKEGPDWKKGRFSQKQLQTSYCGDNGIGTVYECNPYNEYGYQCHRYENDVNMEKMLNVQHEISGICQYKWGKDGEYEVELI